jgi:hypothetical protein
MGMSVRRGSRSDRSSTSVGLLLIGLAAALCFFAPVQSHEQARVTLAILALGAAGIVQGFSGFLVVSSKSRWVVLRAGGPLAVALGVYMIDPPLHENHIERESATNEQRIPAPPRHAPAVPPASTRTGISRCLQSWRDALIGM